MNFFPVKSPQNANAALSDDDLLHRIKEKAKEAKLNWDDFESFVLARKGVENWTHDVLVYTDAHFDKGKAAYLEYAKGAE